MGIRYTIEDVKKEIEKYDCQLLSRNYVDSRKKLEIICNKHRDKGIQLKSFDKIKNRQSCCKYCGWDKNASKKRISQEAVVKRCKELDLLFIGMYQKDGATVVQFKCKIHNKKGVIEMLWDKLRGAKKGCPYCSGKHKTTEDFKLEVFDIFGDKIEILGEYEHNEKHILCKCKVDQNIWHTSPRSLLNGSGCPICGRQRASKYRQKTHEQFVQDMKAINPNIDIIGKYTKSVNKVMCKCKIDNCIWESYASNLLNKSAGCPMCAKKRVYKSQALSNMEFLKRLEIINPTIEPLEVYVNFFKKLLCKCKIHNLEFYQTPHGMLAGKNGCIKCTQTSSEKILNSILEKFNIKYKNEYTFSDCKNILPLRFDAYDCENNIAYEYNGEQHYYAVDFAGRGEEWANKIFNKTKKRDKIKETYCKKNNIPLVIIPYWEKDNMEFFLCKKLSELNINNKIISPNE